MQRLQGQPEPRSKPASLPYNTVPAELVFGSTGSHAISIVMGLIWSTMSSCWLRVDSLDRVGSLRKMGALGLMVTWI